MSYKREVFEYIVHLISIWSKEKERNPLNDLNKLKIIKLHFFVCAISSKEEDEDLLGIFDEFYAMPFGHVESDVYNSINKGELDFFKIGKGEFEFKKEYEISPKITEAHKQIIDRAIQELKGRNSDLIKYTAFDLVELSHRWSSWISIFNYAKSIGKFSEKIPTAIIRNEQKIFSL